MTQHAPPQTTEARRFTFLLASARRDGNTEVLTRVAAEKLPRQWPQRWLRLMDMPLAPFEDIRHSVGAYPEPTGHERVLFDATLDATDLVFVVPLYWYSLPASAKLYLDYWSAWLRVPGAQFKARMAGKTLWGLCVLSDEDPRRAEPLIGALAITADYLKMEFGGVLLGNGSKPGDILSDRQALERARGFFLSTERVRSSKAALNLETSRM
ncbi:flavodoxin family protein [Methylocapsa sp. S129]|uniref:flavodoxin family protein n=1 Tax=Methylocapsa sp. S129 TaxID=1641869 RepID=UPI00131B3E4F|nr:NAD(P)H-dependent oxidoreductase [Methylocapsa sp. S129]